MDVEIRRDAPPIGLWVGVTVIFCQELCFSLKESPGLGPPNVILFSQLSVLKTSVCLKKLDFLTKSQLLSRLLDRHDPFCVQS